MTKVWATCLVTPALAEEYHFLHFDMHSWHSCVICHYMSYISSVVDIYVHTVCVFVHANSGVCALCGLTDF